MVKRGFGACIFIVLFILGVYSPSYARDYLVNYGYKTPHKGEIELELWTDYVNGDTNYFFHQTEIEYGITDRWMVGVYGQFKESAGYDGYKIETRYRFGDKGMWFVDPALYFEYKNPNGSQDVRDDLLEAKLILSKDIGALNLVTNLKFFERGINSHQDVKFGYTFGTSYPFFDKAKLGLEFKGSLGKEGDFRIDDDQKHYIIPGIYMDLWDDIELAVGLGFGLTRESDNFLLKSIIEIEF